MANIIIFFIISLSFFDNLCFVGSFDNILVFFPLIIIYFSLVPLIIYGSLVPLIIFFISIFIILFFSSFGFFDNLWLVGSFDNILVFFPLIIINLWFVCFFDDSIRVRLVILHYIKQKCLPKHHGFIGVIDGNVI